AKMSAQALRRNIDDCYGTAKRPLEENRDKLEMITDALMKYETIDSDPIDDQMAGRVPREPRDWQGGSGTHAQPPNLEASGRR
ncbi:ATP-dependent zinc metalloprotease FtsH, partial [Pseudomonas aeruginosa]